MTRTRPVSRLFPRVWSALGFALLAVLAPTAWAQSSPAFTPAEQAAYPTDGWISNGGSLNNQRYSPLDQINKESIAGMKAKGAFT